LEFSAADWEGGIYPPGAIYFLEECFSFFTREYFKAKGFSRYIRVQP
jgi:hypothetical protein